MSPGCGGALGRVSAVRQLLRNMTRTYLWTTTRRGFWAYNHGEEVSCFAQPDQFPVASQYFFVSRFSEIPCDGVLRRLVQPFVCPAFVPGRFSCALNWAFTAVHPCLFLVLDHGRIVFLYDPRVALWSHSAAELMLMLLAVAGFRMGEL